MFRYSQLPIVVAGNDIYFVGGRHCFSANNCTLLSELYIYSTVSKNGQILPPNNLPARCDHSTVYMPDCCLVVFGGLGDTGYYNDLWIFNFQLNWWPQYSYGPAPSPRGGHSGKSTLQSYNDIIQLHEHPPIK